MAQGIWDPTCATVCPMGVLVFDSCCTVCVAYGIHPRTGGVVLIRSEDVLLSIFRRRGRPVIRNYRYSKSNRDTHARNRDRLRFDENKQAGWARPRPASSTRVATQESSARSDAPRMNRTRVSHTTARARHHPSTPHHNKRMPFYCQPSIIVTATSPHIRCGELGAPRRAPPRAQCDSVWSARREATQSPSS